MVKGKRFNIKGNIAIEFLISFAISALAILLISFVFALVANGLEDSTGNLGIFSLASLLLGAVVGGFASGKIKKDGALLFSALVSLLMVLIMLIICVIMNGKIGGGAFMNYACYIGVAIFSSFLGSKEKKHKHHRK